MDGMLKLVPRSQTGRPHMPIDYFLRTLAEAQGSQGIGVVLSGTATDGTLGLQAIKAEGGIAFAQEPASAQYDGMPRSAIAAGCVDFVLPPEGIAQELTRLGRHPYMAAGEPRALPRSAPAPASGARGQGQPRQDLRPAAEGLRRRLQRLQEDDAPQAHRAPDAREPDRDARGLCAAPRRRRERDRRPSTRTASSR